MDEGSVADEKDSQKELNEKLFDALEDYYNAVKKSSNGAKEYNSKRIIVNIKSLIKKGADIHQKDDDYGNTFLHSAAAFGNKKLIKFWLKKGLKKTERNNKGYPPALVALFGRHLDVVNLLLNNPYTNRPAELTTYPNKDTPLHLLAKLGELKQSYRNKMFEDLDTDEETYYEKIIDYALDKGYRLYDKNKIGETAEDIAKDPKVNNKLFLSVLKDYETKPKDVVEDLFLESERGSLESVMYLTKQIKNSKPSDIADIFEIKNKDGKTILNCASKNSIEVYNNLADLNRDSIFKIKLNKAIKAVEKNSWFANHWWVGRVRKAIKKGFIDSNTIIDFNGEKQTVAEHYLRSGNLSMFKFVVKHGPDLKNIKGENIQQSDIEYTNAIFEQIYNTTGLDQGRLFRFINRISGGKIFVGKRYKLIKLLLDKGIDPNLKSGSRRLLGHKMALRGNLKYIKLLLNHGLSTTVEDRTGRNIMDYARESGNEKILNLLDTFNRKNEYNDKLSLENEAQEQYKEVSSSVLENEEGVGNRTSRPQEPLTNPEEHPDKKKDVIKKLSGRKERIPLINLMHMKSKKIKEGR